ncbi:MAG TPA: hypothetical protein VGP36_06750 [Mycobacteriales bacterium]|jgi:hypothetical protein|nr:hypothetical protein [Mycobacteriales bacterium]
MRKAILGSLVAAGSAAAMLTAGAGVANAAVSPNAVVTCSGTAPHKICQAHVFAGAQVLNANNVVIRNLAPNVVVTVTCYFSNANGTQDHITSPVTGHIDDGSVNFNNHSPKFEGIGPC